MSTVTLHIVPGRSLPVSMYTLSSQNLDKLAVWQFLTPSQQPQDGTPWQPRMARPLTLEGVSRAILEGPPTRLGQGCSKKPLALQHKETELVSSCSFREREPGLKGGKGEGGRLRYQVLYVCRGLFPSPDPQNPSIVPLHGHDKNLYRGHFRFSLILNRHALCVVGHHPVHLSQSA